MKAALRARAVFGADFPVTIVGGLSHHPLGNMNAKNLMGVAKCKAAGFDPRHA